PGAERSMASQDSTSIRLFRNDLLEALTHVHPLVPLLLWGPVAAVLLWRSLVLDGLGPLPLVPVAAAALMAWTVADYLLHRFGFRFPARSRTGKWRLFLCHGVPHDAPQHKTRLVMPPAGAIPVMPLTWGLCGLLIPAPWMHPFLA